MSRTASQRASIFAGLAAAAFTASSASAAFITVFGGPTYNAATNAGYNPVGNTASTVGNGVAVGYAYKVGDGARAVRWDTTGATELGNLGSATNGSTLSGANAINTTGTAVGYDGDNQGEFGVGSRAVRWDASGTAATELGNLGTNSAGGTLCQATAINSAGAAVGFAEKFDPAVINGDLGSRAVRWDASGTAPTELGVLNTINGTAFSRANAINTAGYAVGTFGLYQYQPDRAVLWDLSGSPIDLNTRIDPASGWTLQSATAINDNNWISGYGMFDPDGPGPAAPYSRAFLLNASTLVPEPAALAILSFAGCAHLLRRRRQASRVISGGEQRISA